MENDVPCPLHPGVMMTARSGQYGTFWSHSIPNVGFCDGKKIKPFKPQGAAVPVPGLPPTPVQPSLTREPIPQRDFDAENRGKVRNNIVEALIQHSGTEALKGIAENQIIRRLINTVVDFVMTSEEL